MVLAPRTILQALAGCVFIAALSWAGLRAGILTLTGARYLDERAQRQPESKDWKRPSLGALSGMPLLLASILYMPALQLVLYVVILHEIPAPAWLASLAIWPVLAVLWFVLLTRSPWWPWRRAVWKASYARPAERDNALEPVFEADPQVSGEVAR